jgi:hypothetical protein
MNFKKLLIVACILIVGYSHAQKEMYSKLVEQLQKSQPDLVLNDKVLLVNFTNKAGVGDKATTKELERIAKVYEHAKLRGGKKGIVCIEFVNTIQTEIQMNKDGFVKTKKVIASDAILGNDADYTNVVFTSEGEVLYTNIGTDKLFGSVNQLITR